VPAEGLELLEAGRAQGQVVGGQAEGAGLDQELTAGELELGVQAADTSD
jgi:hypothetical protein